MDEAFGSVTQRVLAAAVASQCWQGATFSQAVVSPAGESSGIMRVPGAASLQRCVGAGCDLPGYDLAWLFKGRCYVLSCQQRENCRPRERPGADSVLAFLRRGSSPSLGRGSPFSSRRRPLLPSSEDGGDLEALEDLPLFEGPRGALPLFDGTRGALPLFEGTRGSLLDPRVLDVEYSEESQEEPDGIGPEMSPLPTRDWFNQSETESDSHPTQTRASQTGSEDRTGTEPAEIRTEPDSRTTPVTDSTHHLNASAPRPPPRHDSISTDQPGPNGLVGSPVEPPLPSSTAGTMRPTTGASRLLQAPPTHIQKVPPAPTPSFPADHPETSATPPSAAPSRSDGSDRGPVAVVGPDRRLVLPQSSVLLDGSGSTGASSFRWEAVSGPPGFLLQNVDRAIATVTGVQAGRYTFRLTVSDQEGATDSAPLTLRVQEASSPPPVAHASGSHTLTLPNNSLVLRGSVSNGDQSRVHFLWTRDPQSPAAGVVLFGSQTQPALFLADLVEGTYLFQLKVTDAQGRSSVATATVEVQPEPAGGEQVELEMLVGVSQVSVLQLDTVVQQLAALIHVLNSDVHVRALEGRSQLSTVLRFSVGGPSGPIPAPRLVALLRTHLLRERSGYLLFRALRVDAVVCSLSCSGRGQCDPITKQCACDPFWTDNLVRHYLGDGESNCEWRVLYVILTSFILVIFILSLGWTFMCCRRRRSQSRKRAKYAVLNNMDEQERLELRPRFSVKHRSTEHNSSLMMSESELDSDQDAAFSRGRRLRSRNRTAACSREAFG
ncbi:dyslexia-associated protein KIAA0319 isoform X2 [Oryzias melastigma]|uniref:dyslexia-associated protein KIAA0319 isoform X2 n=1 Tax=Oryzias melastigma TaxID=30732 RepID=UPI000CF7EFD4|nr:dyslexia-associated protein KIAA0319 isoform X2 [Oryzias melastigma]